MSRWPTIIVATLLAGCARFEPRPLSPADTAAKLDARRLDDDGLKKFVETNLGRELANFRWFPRSCDFSRSIRLHVPLLYIDICGDPLGDTR